MRRGATSPSVGLKLPWEQFGSLERCLRGKRIWQTLPSTSALLGLESLFTQPLAALATALETVLLLLKLGVLSGPVTVHRGAKLPTEKPSGYNSSLEELGLKDTV